MNRLNRISNNYILIAFAFLISIFLYISIFAFVNPLVTKVSTSDENNTIINKTLSLQKVYSTCIDNCMNMDILSSKHQICINTCQGNIEKDKTVSSIAFIAYWNGETKEKAPDWVIKTIFLLIWFALFIEISVLMLINFSKNDKFISKYYEEIVDASLNSAPILGVIGTIYSFALYTTTLDGDSNLIDGFKSSFFDASFTTILAGFVYVTNLYIKIFIFKDSSNDEKK